jgi:sugar phosphate isomerase/epimerase
MNMKRPITIASGQFGDIPFDELCKLVSSIGYEGVEIACHAHLDIHKVLEDDAYVSGFKATLAKHNLKVWALGAHLIGQCVGDNWDPRLDNFAPRALWGKPDEIRAWAVEEMKTVARAAQKLGVKVVTCFLGSPIWPYWYSFPQTPQKLVNEGYQLIRELWTPIFDVFDECDVKFALEVHPTEIAFDYYSTEKLFNIFEYRPTLGLNFDPSHLVWQGVDPCIFLRDFADRIYHVHMKDVKVKLDGKAGILGSHIDFGDTRRGWNFVSLGHGNVDFDGIIRELNQIGYHGPLSVEWEDGGMERTFGAKEAYEFARRMNFEPSDISFDSALKAN